MIRKFKRRRSLRARRQDATVTMPPKTPAGHRGLATPGRPAGPDRPPVGRGVVDRVPGRP